MATPPEPSSTTPNSEKKLAVDHYGYLTMGHMTYPILHLADTGILRLYVLSIKSILGTLNNMKIKKRIYLDKLSATGSYYATNHPYLAGVTAAILLRCPQHRRQT